ncbi:4Fe-4S dicluster domain-containing protein [Pseudemcibacter sp.]|jgi:Fe-S-cluster-containing dehydrogenase component|uniref:4Fe-4S dicluster domain-containing protein n=1 Tax=Pseudemcibacter sp. TaxID=2943293 RepID=UPI003F6995F2|nr:4Fe-4S dicluster domain-containing protein [Kordiimonadaceae bacterium]MDC1090473.1 4Fe-4S dicluster domain-containing protein [Emcibacteraceae bacterium]
MTCLPEKTDKKLGLLIDLNICVGCHACAVNCKEWNTSGITGPMEDLKPYGDDPSGVWYNRIHSYEFKKEGETDRTVYFPKSCLHCDDAPCVTVCPTGASLKRSEDGIVLVNPDVCIGCKLCSWACPYGAREYDTTAGVMQKCTLCVDKIYDESIPEERRVPSCVSTCPAGARHFGDFADPNSNVSQLAAEGDARDLFPEMETKPVNQYLAPEKREQKENKKLTEKVTSVKDALTKWAMLDFTG